MDKSQLVIELKARIGSLKRAYVAELKSLGEDLLHEADHVHDVHISPSGLIQGRASSIDTLSARINQAMSDLQDLESIVPECPQYGGVDIDVREGA